MKAFVSGRTARLLLAILLLLTSVGAVSAAAADLGILKGNVVSSLTGEPVANAQLRFEAFGMSAISAQLGGYIFPSVPTGAATITVTAPGYQNFTRTIEVFGGTQLMDVVLVPTAQVVAPSPRESAGETTPWGWLARYGQGEKRFSLGVVAPLRFITIGTAVVDKMLGYPKSFSGVHFLFGVERKRFFGHPNRDEVEDALYRVTQANPSLYGLDLRNQVKQELGRHSFTYVGYSTYVFVLPNLEIGWALDLTDATGSGWNLQLGGAWGLGTGLVPIPMVQAEFVF